MIAVAWLFSCQEERPIRASEPTLVQPSPLAPYARELGIDFDREVILAGEATDGRHRIPIRGRGASFVIPLVGLYPDAEWTVTLVAADDSGQALVPEPITFRTEPLPEPFPQIELRADDPSVTGLTLLPITARRQPYAWLAVIDDDGEVAWLYDGQGKKFIEARAIDGGIRTMHQDQLLEVDWLGRDRRRLWSESVEAMEGAVVEGARMFSHELSATPRDTWLTLTKEPRVLPAVPISYQSQQTSEQTVSDDVVVEIDPEDGRILSRWAVAEHLDQGRIGYGSLKKGALGIDWGHANAASEHDGRWLVSVRHQDAVLDVDIASGEIRWILANPAGWSEDFRPLLLEPIGEPFAWSWHQHAPKWLGDGQLLVFDNGNYGAAPFTGDRPTPPGGARSRAVLYQIDEQARTVRQQWELSLDPPVSSSAMGDVDRLPDGRILVTHAYVQWEDGSRNHELGRTQTSVRVAEFDPSTGELLWDLDIWGALEDGIGWHSFRADRFERFP